MDQDTDDDAQLVVRGTVDRIVGTRGVYGVAAPVHRVEVEEVLGGHDPGSVIEVASSHLRRLGCRHAPPTRSSPR